MIIKQTIETTVLENGNITAKVTDVYEHETMNYTWTLQNMTPETVENLIVTLSKCLEVSKLVTILKQ